ncbi:MAG: type II toxin-antitoxin system Phd/YefM family antitoxin [Rubrobacter sp.]
MAKMVNVHEAKTHLSRLLEQVVQGEEVVIAKAGKPVVRLVAVKGQGRRREAGSARGQVEMAENFYAPLPGYLQRFFE